MSDTRPSERAMIATIASVQFVNILDFMIVMPLGPDFARALDIPVSQLGWIGGSYTAAACVSGLTGAFFLDRFDRKKALTVALLGLVLGTLAGAFARGLASLMLARVVAGAFGGPATSLANSIVADIIPPSRRGKATSAVMMGFSAATILGVPAALELGRIGGWRLPFLAVAATGTVLGLVAHFVLPPMSEHVSDAREQSRSLAGLVRPDVLTSLVLTTIVTGSTFILVPNISAYVLGNLHYPRAQLGLLYFVGGIVSLGAVRVVGALIDRFGSARLGAFGTLLAIVATYVGFARFPPGLPVVVLFSVYMVGLGSRNVAYNTLTSKVAAPDERARFASVQSAVQHAASALGAFTSSLLLSETADKQIVGMPLVAKLSIGLGLVGIPMMWFVERGVVARAAKTREASR